MDDVIDIARRVYGPTIPESLKNTLYHAEFMVCDAGGRLESMQAIAAIIVAWELTHPEETMYAVSS